MILLFFISPGSIVTKLEIYFRPDYGSKYKTIKELAETSEFQIIRASKEGYTSLSIQSVNLTGKNLSRVRNMEFDLLYQI